MRKDILLWLIFGQPVTGAEGGEGGEGGTGGNTGTGEGGTGTGGTTEGATGATDQSGSSGSTGKAGDPPDSSDDDDDDLPDGKDAQAVLKALRAERAEKRRLEREAKELRNFKQTKDQEGQTALERAQTQARESSQRVKSLATQFRDLALDTAIRDEAMKLGFHDPEDALSIRQAIIDEDGVTQDSEDPANVQVKRRKVEKAVKDLAERKKHLVRAAGVDNSSGAPFNGSTGSSFGSSAGGNAGNMNQQRVDELKTKYRMR
jgi:hypothetical protein